MPSAAFASAHRVLKKGSPNGPNASSLVPKSPNDPPGSIGKPRAPPVTPTSCNGKPRYHAEISGDSIGKEKISLTFNQSASSPRLHIPSRTGCGPPTSHTAPRKKKVNPFFEPFDFLSKRPKSSGGYGRSKERAVRQVYDIHAPVKLLCARPGTASYRKRFRPSTAAPELRDNAPAINAFINPPSVKKQNAAPATTAPTFRETSIRGLYLDSTGNYVNMSCGATLDVAKNRLLDQWEEKRKGKAVIDAEKEHNVYRRRATLDELRSNAQQNFDRTRTMNRKPTFCEKPPAFGETTIISDGATTLPSDITSTQPSTTATSPTDDNSLFPTLQQSSNSSSAADHANIHGTKQSLNDSLGGLHEERARRQREKQDKLFSYVTTKEAEKARQAANYVTPPSKYKTMHSAMQDLNKFERKMQYRRIPLQTITKADRMALRANSHGRDAGSTGRDANSTGGVPLSSSRSSSRNAGPRAKEHLRRAQEFQQRQDSRQDGEFDENESVSNSVPNTERNDQMTREENLEKIREGLERVFTISTELCGQAGVLRHRMQQLCLSEMKTFLGNSGRIRTDSGFSVSPFIMQEFRKACPAIATHVDNLPAYSEPDIVPALQRTVLSDVTVAATCLEHIQRADLGPYRSQMMQRNFDLESMRAAIFGRQKEGDGRVRAFR